MAYTNEQIQQIVDWFFTEGTRQYIGARYVPVFADPIAHSSTRTYEPLTIVQYQGNSYTSKQYVPTGIAVTDERYWALTGNYNAQVEQYRQEVANYVDTVNGFNDRITENTNNISDIENQVNLNDYNEFVVFGDSWSDESIDATIWPTIVANALNLNLHNYAINGSHSSSSTIALANQVQTFLADTSYDKRKVKHVCLTYGVNDQWTYPITANEAKTAMQNFIAAVLNACPNAIIHHFIDFTYGFNNNPLTAQWRFAQSAYFSIDSEKYIPKYLFPYFSVSDMNPSNYFHLTQYAQRHTLARGILANLTGGDFNYKPICSVAIRKWPGVFIELNYIVQENYYGIGGYIYKTNAYQSGMVSNTTLELAYPCPFSVGNETLQLALYETDYITQGNWFVHFYNSFSASSGQVGELINKAVVAFNLDELTPNKFFPFQINFRFGDFNTITE